MLIAKSTISCGRFVAGAALSLLVFGGAQAQDVPGHLGVPVDLREEVRDSHIFVFDDTVSAADVRGRANALANGQGGRVTHVYSAAIRGFAAKMPAAAAQRLADQNPEIAYFEPDGIAFAFPKPPWAGGGGDDTDSGCDSQVIPLGVQRVGWFDASNLSSYAWIIDTGIDLDHQDLNVNRGLSANFVSRGKNSPDDGNGHGTHVAGTVAAIDNECDVVGVAAGATVVAVRVLDNSGSGSYSGVIAGVNYVAAYGESGDVANMSLGGPGSQALDDAVEGAAASGIFFSLAAGNSGAHAGNFSPARANGPNIYTVSAISAANDAFASFSNYGNPPVDCAAPGVSVLSTRRGGGTTTYSGTSMAAPHVAGLLLSGIDPIANADGTAIGDPDGTPDPICHM